MYLLYILNYKLVLLHLLFDVSLPRKCRQCGIKFQVFENLVEIQKDLSLSIQDVTKLQKIYKDEEHLARDARVKAADADDKSVWFSTI